MPYDDILRKYDHEQTERTELETAEATAKARFIAAIEVAKPIFNEVAEKAFSTLEKMERKPTIAQKVDVKDVQRKHRDLVHSATESWFTLSFFPEGTEHGTPMKRAPVHVIPVYETNSLHVYGLITALGNKTEYHHYGSITESELTSSPEMLRVKLDRMFQTIIESMRALGPPL
jgi:hypothetical protein